MGVCGRRPQWVPEVKPLVRGTKFKKEIGAKGDQREDLMFKVLALALTTLEVSGLDNKTWFTSLHKTWFTSLPLHLFT